MRCCFVAANIILDKERISLGYYALADGIKMNTQKTSKKKSLMILLALILMISIIPMTGCGGAEEEAAPAELTGWEYIQDKGELIVGLDDSFAPMGFRDESGNLVGFDVDMANAVGEILGVTVTFQPIDWDSKQLELDSKRIDCIWNGLSVTPERLESMSMSKMYLNNCNIVMAFNPEVVVKTEADLANYKIGTQADSSAVTVMQASENYDLYSANVSEYRTFDEAILDMEAGRVDCIVVDQVLGEYKNSKMDNRLITCDFNFGDDFFAIGCRKADTTLTDKLNETLQTLIDDGTAAEISNAWFGKDIVMLKGYDE